MSTARSTSTTTLLLLLALVAIQGALVGYVFTPGTHPGGDNAAYVSLADALAEGQGYVERWEPGAPNHTKYPPVFSGLLALLALLGAERWVTYKLVGALSAVVAVGATFLWARRRIPDGFAAAAALATGASYTLLFHSRFILSDVPFLAFTMLAVWLLQSPSDETSAAYDSGGESSGAERRGVGAFDELSSPTFAGAVLFVVLAYFTRSAGLPLVLALFGVLAFARAWRRLGASLFVIGGFAALWGGRTGSEQGAYGVEFLLVNPYEPALGQIDPAGMLARLGSNANSYLTDYLPASIAGPAAAPWVEAFVIAGTLLGVVGWAVAAWPRAGRRPGVVELFVPLYAGLVLVWPEVWSGDRFALPLVPFLLVYAIEALRRGSRLLVPSVGSDAASGRARLALAAPGVLVVALLWGISPGVSALAADADACADLIIEENAWTCSGAGTLELVDAARWSGAFLPEDAVVLSRKPRIFHVESGVPSRTYPFLDDPQALFDEANAVGARYVVLDRVSSQGMRFIGGALLARPERFCAIRSFSVAPGGSTELLGLLPEGEPSGTTASQGAVTFAACPDAYLRETFDVISDPRDRIPILID